jgi:hypothetical protein
MENKTTQTISNQEKAKELIAIKYKAETNLVLYWHFQTIKEELFNDYLDNIKGGF